MNEEIREKDLIVIPPNAALSVFTTEGAIDPILARVRHEIDAFVPDMETAAGRKDIAAIAYRVSQSKARLEEVGKELAAEQKKIPKLIDATRKRVRDTLDAWRDEVRAPLTEWETAEQVRLDMIKADLAEWQGVIDDHSEQPSEIIKERLAEVEAEDVTEERFGECLPIACDLKAKALASLQAQIAQAEKREAEAAELARLRAESEERAKRDHEEAIRKEAAETAAKAERQAVEDERLRAERRERELRQEAEDEKRRADEAEARAKREAEEAAAEAARKKAAREADEAYRAQVHRDALAGFIAEGIAEETAREVVRLIAHGKIPGISIEY